MSPSYILHDFSHVPQSFFLSSLLFPFPKTSGKQSPTSGASTLAWVFKACPLSYIIETTRLGL